VTTPSDSDLPVAPPAVELEPPVVPAVPTSVVVSYWILIGCAAVNVLIVAITLLTWTRVIDQLTAQPQPDGTTLTVSQVHSTLIENLVLNLIFAGLFVLFAILMRRGRNWARLAITAIVVAFALLAVLNGAGRVTLISVLLELVAVSMLYTKPAKAYFVAAKAASRLGR
jgi:hypothetical protein